MSNPLAIAAVTATLRNLLTARIHDDAELNDAQVTTRPLDRVRDGNAGNQLNLFLYQTVIDGALRNTDVPGRQRPGETGHPALPLNLCYLITAFGRDDDEVLAHRLLGHSMATLHDHPVLGREEIQAALADNDLHEQIERVRITPQPLSLDELSKLWAAFQTQFRVSAAYEVAVVLIDSRLPLRAPLPVLTRGVQDRGVITVIGSLPTLEEVVPPDGMPSARLGDVLTLRGRHLAGGSVQVLLRTALLNEPVEPVEVQVQSESELRARLPDPGDLTDATSPAATFPVGFYRATVIQRRDGEPDRRSNEQPFALVPQIQRIEPNPAPRDQDGNLTLTITLSQRIRPEQRVALLLGDREIPAQPHPAASEVARFDVVKAAVGEFVLRVRVDGTDTMPVDRAARPFRFADGQKVRIT
jgi:hypothetical protein